ncbi:MAG: NAD(P)-dependent alcohol dehydrogenase [Steroidobacteraceae bacterium]
MTQQQSKAVMLERPGPLPKPILRDAPKPQRQEVLLRVHSSSVNFHDYVLCTFPQAVGGTLAWPRVPFSDASAEVVELGADVENMAVGDRVMPNFFCDWVTGRPTDQLLATVYGDQVDGALQTYMRATARSLVKTPAHLSHREAGTLGCAGLTAWRALHEEGRLQPGGTVLVQGTGGVSLFALGFAKMSGATVILTSSSEEKLDRARALGADHLINYRAHPDWELEVLKLTEGRGVDIILDVGGANTLAKSVEAARIDGHVSVIGVLTGFESPSFPLARVMQRNLSVRGITVGSQSQFASMCEAIAKHRYRPVLDENYPLENAEEAIQRLVSQRHFGKITVSIGD